MALALQPGADPMEKTLEMMLAEMLDKALAEERHLRAVIAHLEARIKELETA